MATFTIATVYYQEHLEEPGKRLRCYGERGDILLHVDDTAAILEMSAAELLTHIGPQTRRAEFEDGLYFHTEGLDHVCVRMLEKGPAPPFHSWVIDKLDDFLFERRETEEIAHDRAAALLSPVNARLDDICDSLERIIAVLPAHVELPRRRTQFIDVNRHSKVG